MRCWRRPGASRSARRRQHGAPRRAACGCRGIYSAEAGWGAEGAGAAESVQGAAEGAEGAEGADRPGAEGVQRVYIVRVHRP